MKRDDMFPFLVPGGLVPKGTDVPNERHKTMPKRSIDAVESDFDRRVRQHVLAEANIVRQVFSSPSFETLRVGKPDDDADDGDDADLVWTKLDRVQMKIAQTERKLAALVKEQDLLNAKLDKIPGARYVPSSPAYSPGGGDEEE
tara:strand:- start:697 stop:1128 length:432 start_codon:yes stop_codon:yes gene_type:complete